MTDRETRQAERLPAAVRAQMWLRRVVRVVGFESNWYLVLLAALVGSVTGLGAIVFGWLLHVTEQLLYEHANAAGATPWWLLIAGPVGGALVCGLIVWGVPEARGHGVPEVMAALHRQRGRIPARVAAGKTAASAITIGSGGSAGAEGPIVQIGAAIGSSIARLLHASSEHTSTLVGCGAAAGLAGIFNAPIAGMFFVLEVLLRDFSLRTFAPIVVASVFSAALTQALQGGNVAIFATQTGLDTYTFTLFELPYYALLGLICGVVAVVFTRLLHLLENLYERLRLPIAIKPATGAVLLGLLGVAAGLWMKRSAGEGPEPPFYGSGYPFIRDCLNVGFYSADRTGSLFAWLGALTVLKIIATCFTLGSGGSGSVFGPSLFIGATAGGAFGVALHQVNPFGAELASPAAYALVGMAAMLAGATHAPLTAIMMLFELTRDEYVLAPIMLAAVLATIVSQLLLHGSIYTMKLKQLGIRVGALSDTTLLRRITVGQVPLAPATRVHPEDPAQRLLELAESRDVIDFVVVDEGDRYAGMVTADDLRTTLLQIEALPLLVVGELMRTDIPTTTRDETLDVVMDKFSQHDAGSLAVLSPNGEARVLGVITRSRMMRQYHLALEEAQ